MKRHVYIVPAVLLGLLLTQLLATVQVFLSNTQIHEAVTKIAQAGYLSVPNSLVLPTLKDFSPAFWGGLFFTLSLGAGLSIAASVCAWLWDRLLYRNKRWLTPFIVLWISPLLAVNRRGFAPLESVYFFLIPLVVFITTLRWMPEERGNKTWQKRLAHSLPFILATLIWTVHADRFLFVNIRDFVLLSNPVGKAVNEFYYCYTLYPAQVFKSFEQKTLKTCRLSLEDEQVPVEKIKRALLNHDYIPVGDWEDVDLEVRRENGNIQLRHRKKTIMTMTVNEFLKNPSGRLRDYSTKTDQHGFFRKATILSLLVGFPLLLYILVFAIIRLLLLKWLGPMPSLMATSVLCVFVAVALFLPLRFGHVSLDDVSGLSKAVNSENWQHKVAAFRFIVERKIEIGRFPDYKKSLKSPHIPVRYWLSKALGQSRDGNTIKDLSHLLNDPQPNVKCMAIEGLGKRGDLQIRRTLLQRFDKFGHWYVQWYAYRALKTLGWRQGDNTTP